MYSKLVNVHRNPINIGFGFRMVKCTRSSNVVNIRKKRFVKKLRKRKSYPSTSFEASSTLNKPALNPKPSSGKLRFTKFVYRHVNRPMPKLVPCPYFHRMYSIIRRNAWENMKLQAKHASTLRRYSADESSVSEINFIAGKEKVKKLRKKRSPTQLVFKI